MAISSFDDYPVHQAAEYVRHPATSDRNFYDRYYFNLHGSSDEVFTIFGLGQYPNLGVTDAFVCATDGERHRVVRASQPLADRADTAVGPIRIEVVEPLRRLRVVCDDDGDIGLDVAWEGTTAPFEEPRQYLRSEGRVVFDTQRFAQLGRWTGELRVGDRTWQVSPDRWGGSRDRSWGVRPVGEREPDGIRRDRSVMSGLWNYFPVDFGDHALVYMLHETDAGERPLEEAVRVGPDGAIEHLGRPEHDHHVRSGTRVLSGSAVHFPEAGITMTATSLLTNYVSVGTGYGMDDDWRHGMYQGPDLVVQRLDRAQDEVAALGQYGVVDHVARFEYDDGGTHRVGYGLYEHGFFGPYRRYGLEERGDVAP